jgi:hypothetical protein
VRYRAGFADDLELGIGTEEIDQPTPNNFMVID